MTIAGGLPTIFVADMDAAVRFYTETLGLELLERYGNHWASVDGGHGLTIGLHPASAENPAGRVGSISIGFRSSDPIRDTVATLKARGVVFRGERVVRDVVLRLFEPGLGRGQFTLCRRQDGFERLAIDPIRIIRMASKAVACARNLFFPKRTKAINAP
jgi:catechol 2,3-dioxygenase-like lactoylglutathione lyase family enzyme